MRPADFRDAEPAFDPIDYLTGPVSSWGVIESRTGEPLRRFRTEVVGTPARDGTLRLDQHFVFENGDTEDRTWALTRTDSHTIQATSPDVSGVASGEVWGNAFHYSYILKTNPGNPFTNVRMNHWMYLQRDGTVINRVRVSKLGITLRTITEVFRRGAEPVPSIGTEAGTANDDPVSRD